MMRACFLLLFFFCALAITAQSPLKQFKKLSAPEKCWVLSHPFIAKRALEITRKVEADVDSLQREGSIGTDNHGGRLDAFKHAYWMASLSREIGCRRSLKLGKAHEKANRLQFEKHELEESILPDSASSEMDLRNNSAGALLVKKKEKITATELRLRVMDALADGRLVLIRKDASGRFLYCDGRIIPMEEWKGKWNIPKCIISSAQQ